MVAETVTSELFENELEEFKSALKANGVSGALRYLNDRTPHRYTGIYNFDRDTLRNVVLYDRFDLSLTRGEDAPMSATYCSLVKEQQILKINDANEDERVKGLINTSVVSYCGVLIKDSTGKPFGTLCHFDIQRCQERLSDFPLLEAAAKILYAHLHSKV